MDELNTTAELQDTTPAAEAHADENGQSPESGTPQPETATEGAQDSENNAADGAGEEPEWSLPVVFNHENRSLSKEEAIRYAQIGLKYGGGAFDYDKAQTLYNKLDYLAALQDTTPDALIDGLTSAQEASYRAELSERFGADDEAIIEDMMALYRNKQKDKYEKVLADRKAAETHAAEEREVNLNTRLAEEFSAMKADFPELTDFAALPVEVKKAASEGMPLEYAYLKYGHTENKKIVSAAKSAKKAAEASAGSMSSEKENKESLLDDFIKEFRK